MLHKVLLAFVLLSSTTCVSLLAAPKGPAPSAPPNDRAAVEGLALPFAKQRPWLGLVIGVTRPQGQQVYGYGQVKLEGQTRTPTADTLFEIGSITKTFTATLLAEMVRGGTVRLDDPAQKYLPADIQLPRRDGRDITLLHLATHSSSLPRDLPAIGLLALAAGDFDNPFAAIKNKTLQEGLADIRLPRPIGCKVEYSNLGVGLLGMSLAGAAHAKSYEELLKARVTG